MEPELFEKDLYHGADFDELDSAGRNCCRAQNDSLACRRVGDRRDAHFRDAVRQGIDAHVDGVKLRPRREPLLFKQPVDELLWNVADARLLWDSEDFCFKVALLDGRSAAVGRRGMTRAPRTIFLGYSLLI
jgi:hypothetical protein